MANMEENLYNPLCSIKYTGSVVYDYTQFMSSELERNIALENDRPLLPLPYTIEAKGCNVMGNNLPVNLPQGIINYLKSFGKLSGLVGETQAEEHWKRYDQLFRVIGEIQEDKLFLSVITDTPFIGRLMWQFGAVRLRFHGTITYKLDKMPTTFRLTDPKFGIKFTCYESGPTVLKETFAVVPVKYLMESVDPPATSVSLEINANLDLKYEIVEDLEPSFKTSVTVNFRKLLKPYDYNIELDNTDTIPCRKSFLLACLQDSSVLLKDEMSKTENLNSIKLHGVEKPGANIFLDYVSGFDVKIKEISVDTATQLITLAVEKGMQPLGEVMQDLIIIFYRNKLSLDQSIEIFKVSKFPEYLSRISCFALSLIREATHDEIMALASFQKLSNDEKQTMRPDLFPNFESYSS